MSNSAVNDASNCDILHKFGEFDTSYPYVGSVLHVEMDDGSWWEIPTQIIANSRASFVANNAKQELALEVFAAEFALMKAEDKIIEWAESYMEWEDVKFYAKMIKAKIMSSASDYDNDWKVGMKRVAVR